MTRFLFLVFCFFTVQAQATGIVFEPALGYPNVSIKNSDGTQAHYSGLSFKAQIRIPVFETPTFGLTTNLMGTYHDLSNNANGSGQDEVANHIGPGAGLEFHIRRFRIGGNYNYMKARHFWVGPINDKNEFQYSSMGFHAGLEFSITKELGIAFTYASSSGVLAKAETGLLGDANYTDTVYWLSLTYSTKKGFGAFLSDIFGK